MSRRLLNLLTALSLMLCVAVLVLWVRSYWRYDLPAVGVGNTAVYVHAVNGSLYFQWAWDGEAARRPPWVQLKSDRARRAAGQGLLGFGAYHGLSQRTPPMSRVVGLVMPHWAVAVGAAIVPGWRFARWRRRLRIRRRAQRGLCPS